MDTTLLTAAESPAACLISELAGDRSHESATDVIIRPLSMLTSDDVVAWRSLATQAAEPNPFQEPEFILPLAEHLLPQEDLRILTVADSVSGDWIAACVLQACEPSLTRPLPHLRALQSPYSFLDSPLIDRRRTVRAVRDALGYLKHQRTWHGVRFRLQNGECPQAAVMQSQAQSLGLAVDCDRAWTRATTDLAALRVSPLIDRCSKSRRKSLLRGRRSLEKAGPVEHRLVSTAPDCDRACDEFLRLESLGWKGRAGTAMTCRPQDADFLRSITRQFADSGRILFGELLVGDRVIASTCNLVSGRRVFALKLGWDPEFSSGNPGHWAEIELATALSQERPDLEMIDSCSQPGSYVESVSTGCAAMSSTVFVWSRRASALCEVRRQFRALKSGWLAEAPDSDRLPGLL